MPRRACEPSQAAAPARRFARRSSVCDKSLTGLADVFTQIVRGDNLQPAAAYDNFIAVLDRDANDAQASIRLVLAQPSISSQMIDNLNASIHLRALLTDLFLIDEIVRPEAAAMPSANAPSE